MVVVGRNTADRNAECGRRTWLLDLSGHLDDARRAASGRGGVVADESARGAGSNTREHICCDGTDAESRRSVVARSIRKKQRECERTGADKRQCEVKRSEVNVDVEVRMNVGKRKPTDI